MPPKGRLADYLLGGLFLGLSVAAKYSSGLGAVPLVVAHLLAREGSPGCSRGLQPARGVGRGGLRHRLHPAATAARTHLPLLLAGGASLAAFVLSNPYCLLDAPSFLDEFRSQYGWASDPFRTSDQAIGLVILRSLWVGTGPTVLAAALLGLAVLAFQKPREALLLVSFPLAYVVFFLIASDLFFARFAIPMLPFVSILAGYGAVAVLGYGGVDWVFRGALWALAIAALVLPSVVLDVRYNSLMRAEDTRVLLGRWIDVNVPPGSKMAVEGYSFVDTRGRWLGSRKVQYRMEIFSSLRLHPPEFYAREKFDYLVVSSFVYSRYGLNPEAHAESIDSYRQMDAQFPLAASFFPTDDGRELPFLMDEEIAPIYTVLERDRPGPTVKVYRLSEPPRYGVEWGEIAVPADMAPGQRVGVQVAPRNTGNLAWPWEGYNAVRISGRWLDRNGQEVAGLDRRGSLPREVEPGGAVAVQFDLAAPPDPGDYTLRLDLVQENFAWFSNLGARAKDVAVRVR